MGLLTDRINNRLEKSNFIYEHALNNEPVPNKQFDPTLFLIHHHWKMYERKLKKKQMLRTHYTEDERMKQKTFLPRPVYLFSTQVMLNGVKCTCRIYSRTILLFSFVFFF